MYYELIKTDKSGNNVKKFKAKSSDDVTLHRDAGITNLPITETDADGTILVKLFGTTEDVRFSFKLTSETQEDISEGTESSWAYSGGFTQVDPDTGLTRTQIKVLDQIKYIKSNFITATSDDLFQLNIKDSDATLGTITYGQGVFSDLSITYKAGANMAEVSLTFMLGTVQ